MIVVTTPRARQVLQNRPLLNHSDTIAAVMPPRRRRRTKAEMRADEEAELPNEVSIPGTSRRVDVPWTDGRKWLLKFSKISSGNSFTLFFVRRQFFPLDVPGQLVIPTVTVPGVVDGEPGPHILVPVAYQSWVTRSHLIEEQARSFFDRNGHQDLTDYTIATWPNENPDRRIEHIFNPVHRITT